MYIVSLISALLLAAAILRMLTATHGYQNLAFAVLVSMIVCAVHAVVLVMYPIRHTKPLAILLGAMGCVSIVCLFLLAVSGQPNYQIQSIGNLPAVPSPVTPK